MQDINKLIEDIVKAKFPDANMRDEMYTKVGEIVLLETLEAVLVRLPNETAKVTLSNLMKEGHIDMAFKYAEKNGVKMEDIFEKTAVSVVVEMLK